MSQAAFNHDAGPTSSEAFMIPGNLQGILPTNMTFLQSLLDNLSHGVVFLDPTCRITSWNFGMEQLTGLGNSVLGRKFNSGLLQLHDLQGELLNDLQCPFPNWLQERKSTVESYILSGRSGREVQVELSFHPVVTSNGELLGATVIIVDTSAQLELQKQLNELYAIAVLDPLTQVANRAEFERLLDEYVRTHLAIGLKCSIIIADLDYFKQINDNYGHHVGDQALISFAQHLKQFVRSHDFVARYGGEEFVILCANCDEASAMQRADEIRVSLASYPQPALGGKCISASFGVSELIAEDSATGLFVRADHALLKAKELGRNRAVAASSMTSSPSSSNEDTVTAAPTASGINWRVLPNEPLVGEEYFSSMPLMILLEKIRGFIEETESKIIRIEDGLASFRLAVSDPKRPSRKLNFQLELDIESAENASEKSRQLYPKACFFLRVSIFQEVSRWHNELREDAAQKLLQSFLSLTMLNNPEFHIRRLEMATEKKSRY